MPNYVNPIGKGLVIGRTDQGVDFSGAGPLYALGAGQIVNVYNSGWPGGTFIALKLDGTNQYVYYAEDIAPAVQVGQRVTSGQIIGHATGGGSGIEIGWAAPPGSGESLARSVGQTAFPTQWGTNFANLLKSLSVSTGIQLTSYTSPSPGSTPSLFVPIITPLEHLPWLGPMISGFFGGAANAVGGAVQAGATIGDVATAIAGIVDDISKFMKWISWLFVPSHWVRVGAFIVGIASLSGGIYMLKGAF